jgi:phosphoglycerate dehydrogenase-like enzyme
MRVLLCGKTFSSVYTELRQRLPHDEIASCDAEDVRAAVAGADVVVPLMARIDAATMDEGRFRLIQQFGAGLEGVDLAAARARGIWVANAPTSTTGNAESVAEHAVLLMLAVLRRLPDCATSIATGILGSPRGRALGGLTVCLFGVGAIARALAARLRPFDVRLIGVTRRPESVDTAGLGMAACHSFNDRLLAFGQSDVLVVCLPLTDDTRQAVDAAALAALPKGAIVVNVARGPIVDYEALRAALSSGHLGGAGLDVFWQEPIAPDDPLLRLPNLVVTPHVAGVTDRSYTGTADIVAANVERLRRGEPPAYRAL